MSSETSVFYERRKNILPIEFLDRRRIQRRLNVEAVSSDRRRLTSQVRQYEREPIHIPVRLHIDCKETLGETQNISAGGLLILINNSLPTGTAITLQFSFGESVCYLSIIGQVVFCCLGKSDRSAQYMIGIKFSAIHDFDKKILNTAIQILGQNIATQDKSLLNIIVSKDNLASEATSLIQKRTTNNLNTKADVTKTDKRQNTTYQRRKHLRYKTQLKETVFGVTPNGEMVEVPCTVINLSRYGICFTTTLDITKEAFKTTPQLSLLNVEIGIKILRQESSEDGLFLYAGEMTFPQEAGRRTIHIFLKTLGNEKIGERRNRENSQITAGGEQEKIKVNRRRNLGIFTECTSFATRLPKWKTIYNYYYQSESIRPGRIIVNGREHISLGAKDYLGVAHDPRVKEAAVKALERYGTTAWSRVLNGTPPLYEELEEELASFKGYEGALLFTGGYVANITILKTLLRKADTVFLDENVHASIFDGCIAAGAKIIIFKHNSVEDLEYKIQHETYYRKLIILDGVYSVQGDLAHLTHITKVANEYEIPIMVDDAHGLGIMGATGSGTPEHFGLKGEMDIEVASFSAALAGVGGVIVCKKEIRDYLLHFSNGILFTTSLPPASVAGTLAALRIIKEDLSLRHRLWSNVNNLKTGLESLGYQVAPSASAIISIQVGNEEMAYCIAHLLEKRNVCVNTFRRPAVKRGDARIRISASAAHSKSDIDTVLEAFKEIKAYLPERIFQNQGSPF